MVDRGTPSTAPSRAAFPAGGSSGAVSSLPVATRPSWFDQPWVGILICSSSLWRYAVDARRAPTLVHDNLDSVVVWQKIVAEGGLLWAPDDAIVPQIMGGIPRAYFDSELNVFSLLNALVSPFHAFGINAALMLSVGYLGMWLLVRRHLQPESPSQPWLAHGVAMSFALLPHWPGGGLSVAGTPLLLNAFLNLRQGGRARRFAALDWAVLVLFPFYSSIVLCFAVYLLFGVVMLADLLRGRLSWRVVAALVLFTAAYAVVEHRLVGMMVSGGAPSHRVEFQSKVATIARGARDAAQIFVRGQYHAATLHTHVILPTVALALLVSRGMGESARRLWALVAGLVATAVVYGTLNLAALEPLRARIALLRTFNFGRVHWLQPLLWYAAFAVALGLLDRRLRARVELRTVAGWLVLPLALQVADVSWQASKARNVGGRSISFAAFYGSDLFGQIKDFIGLPVESYRVVSVGMHPAVALYNGFFTLDGYLPNYPLSYKRQFRRIIAAELARDDALRAYFDGWGSRAYVFSSELWGRCGSLCTKESPAKVQELKLDIRALFDQGGRYVFSAVPISKADGLEFLRRFESDEAAWTVYLYAVTPPSAAVPGSREQPPLL
jgi:hypothetical protein